MKRINNNDFKKKSALQKFQYLKDGDDDHCHTIRSLNGKLRVIITILSTMFVMIAGYLFDLIFLH